MSNFLSKHGIVSTVAALWAMAIFNWVTVQVFTDLTKINEWVAAAYATFFAVLGVAWKFYAERNGKEP